MDSREKFERWMCLPHHSGDVYRVPNDIGPENEYYESSHTQFAWEAWQARDVEIADAEREAVRKCAELLARKDGSFCNEIEVIRAAYPQHFAEVKPQPNPASPQPEF
jgi:hypothetical protein